MCGMELQSVPAMAWRSDHREKERMVGMARISTPREEKGAACCAHAGKGGCMVDVYTEIGERERRREGDVREGECVR